MGLPSVPVAAIVSGLEAGQVRQEFHSGFDIMQASLGIDADSQTRSRMAGQHLQVLTEPPDETMWLM